MTETVLEMRHITKIYSNGFRANLDVCFSARAGEIHALVGENGAGKTTLMKVLFGIEKPERGEVLLYGKPVALKNPADAIQHGIGMVHQHFMLVDSLTVAENMVLGIRAGLGAFSYADAVRQTEQVAAQYGLPVDPHARVRDLPVGIKQRIEILKALLRGAKLLILDEPTAVLTPQETTELFTQLRAIRQAGHTIIFISHKLKEIKSLCDRITVLRAGRSVGVCDTAAVTERDISRLMVGRDVLLHVDKQPPKPGTPVLEVQELSLRQDGKDILRQVSFCIRAGEILGVAGVEGNGQRELSEMITGLRSYESGQIRILGQEAGRCTVRQLRALGTAHISEDRMTYGVMQNGTIEENLIADRYNKPAYQWGPLLHSQRLRALAGELIHRYQIKCDGCDQPIRMLSGGNMQKVVAAREFSSAPKLIVANQPTRGIDVGASEFIRSQLIALRDQGAAVLLISADLNEVMEVSDRVIVMCGGEISARYETAADITEEELGEYMLGIRRQTDLPQEEERHGTEEN